MLANGLSVTWSVNMQMNLQADLLGFASCPCAVFPPELLEYFVFSNLATPDALEIQIYDKIIKVIKYCNFKEASSVSGYRMMQLTSCTFASNARVL